MARNRGGARPGAGRKALGPDEKKQTVAFRLSPMLVAKLKARANERGQTPTELIAELLENDL